MRAIVIAGWVAACLVTLHGQAGPAGPVFETATVKRNVSGDLNSSGGPQGNTYRLVNVPLRRIIAAAFGIVDDQLRGGPGWLATDRYDITANAAQRPVGEALRSMLRALLADRFKLATHEDQQPLQHADLTVAKSGRLGPHLTQLPEHACDRDTPAATANPCSTQTFHIGSWKAHGISLDQLAFTLQFSMGAAPLVINKTDLPGFYDVELEWDPASVAGPTATASDKPPLPTALEEQLGLRFRTSSEPTRAIVIDRVEKPEAD
jgi:uncharacterized protein (TIGR03435 family)